MAAIRSEGLSKYYGDVRGIEDLTFDVREGEIFGFLGPNGAGKTTFIRTLLGFQSPTAGSAELLGRDIADQQALVAAKADVGYLPSDPGLDEGVTGRRLLDYYGSLRGDSRSAELLETFTPPLDRKVGEYSRGNKQMLAIVIAFMHDPDLVVMDEPTSGLDPLKQERFHEFVRSEAAAGKTLFLSSHILSEVQKVCDRVGIIREGRLVELETVEELLSRGGKVVRVRVRGEAGPEAFAIDGVHDLTIGAGEDERLVGHGGDSTTVSFTFTGDYDALVAHLTGFEVLGIDIEEAPLEDVFLRFYGDAPDGDGTESGPAAAENGAAPEEGA
ncbi:ABC transporter ATP-binding protein [Haloglomus litoreum]|uniref:ABC transporter ATP-binding protein n=1 Tax=Haloglomus litoreum TaxID=3034026 RepID=UPI0023E8766F|nr:ABC transporter ATP-binding protein [Haloglomus sp. DT116]